MATYAKIINGLTALGIHKMQEYLDTYIEFDFQPGINKKSTA